MPAKCLADMRVPTTDCMYNDPLRASTILLTLLTVTCICPTIPYQATRCGYRGLHAAPAAHGRASHTPNIVSIAPLLANAPCLQVSLEVEEPRYCVKLELVELSDSDCDERDGKTIVLGNGRFRAVCMKTVLQYVTYSTDDPTAAFLWVRARVQGGNFFKFYMRSRTEMEIWVNALQHRNASGPSILPPGSRLTYQPQLDTPAEVLDVLKQGLRPSELCDVLRIAQTDRDQLPCEGAVDLLGGPLAWSTRTASFVHAHDGPTLCKAVLMRQSGRLLALGVAAGLLWMHAFHRHTQHSLVVMSTTEEECGRVALSLGARPADTAHGNSAEGVSKTWVWEGVTLVFGGDECPQGACVVMGKNCWDASVEQQLVANRAPGLIFCQRSEESIVVCLKALERCWMPCWHEDLRTDMVVDVDHGGFVWDTVDEEVQPPASEYGWTAMRVAHKDFALDRLRRSFTLCEEVSLTDEESSVLLHHNVSPFKIAYTECVICRSSIELATDTVVACEECNCTYAHLMCFTHMPRVRCCICRTDLTQLLTVGPLSQEEMLIPRYKAFDSHDGPVVMLTCQGFCGPPDTVCERLFSKELHSEAEMVTYQKTLADTLLALDSCRTALISVSKEARDGAGGCGNSCSERARLCIQESYSRIGSKEAVIEPTLLVSAMDVTRCIAAVAFAKSNTLLRVVLTQHAPVLPEVSLQIGSIVVVCPCDHQGVCEAVGRLVRAATCHKAGRVPIIRAVSYPEPM